MSLVTLEVEDVCPLAILLITSGSGGNRLLFKYPSYKQKSLYEIFNENNLVHTKPIFEERYDNSNPIADLIKKFDDISIRTSVDVETDTHDLNKPFSYIDNGHLSSEIKDDILASLLSCKSDDFGERLFVKLEDVVFIGQMTHQDEFIMKIRKSPPTIKHFSIVFAFKSTAKKSTLHYYYYLARSIASTICVEEKGMQFLSKEKDLIVIIHDEVQERASENLDVNELLFERSKLYQQLINVVNQSVSIGIVNGNVGNRSCITYCVGTRIYHVIDNLYINACDALDNSHDVMLYHTLILLNPAEKIISLLSPESNQRMKTFLSHISIRGNIHTATVSTGNISLNLGLRMATALIHWGQAVPCYPLEPDNRYMLTPYSHVILSYPSILLDFHEKFPTLFLPEVLDEIQRYQLISRTFFYLKIEFKSDLSDRLIIWLIKNRIIYQVHQYYTCLKRCNENDQRAVSAAVNYTSLPRNLFTDELSWRKFADILTNNSIVYSAEELATDFNNWEPLGRIGIGILNDMLPLCDGRNHLEALIYVLATKRQQSPLAFKNFRLAASIFKIFKQLNKMFTKTEAPDRAISVFVGVN